MGLSIVNFSSLLLFMVIEVCFQFQFAVWMFGFVVGFLWLEVGEKKMINWVFLISSSIVELKFSRLEFHVDFFSTLTLPPYETRVQ